MPEDKISQRIRSRSRELPPTLVKVLHFLDANRLDVLSKSALEVGAAVGTSDASVIRAIQALGYASMKDFKQALAASLGQGQTAADKMARTFKSLDEWHAEPIQLVLDDHRKALDGLASPETRAQIGAAVTLLARAPKIGIFGLGPSGAIAHYFALGLSRIGRRAHIFDGNGQSLPDQLLHIDDLDAAVMLAYGRPSREATIFAEEIRQLRKPIVLITDPVEQSLTTKASVVITVHRGDAGRVALHAATLACLEAITVALASSDKKRSVSTLERLNELRRAAGHAGHKTTTER